MLTMGGDNISLMLIDRIATDEILDAAYQWLCAKRAHHHFNSDVWQVRQWWDEKKLLLQQQLRSGSYRFRELGLFWGEEQFIEYWSSLDALVLKAMSLVLTEHLKPHLSSRCFHLAGSGGMKAAVREVAANVGSNQFVFRTDVKGYYASINHQILMEIVGRYVHDEAVLALLWGYLRRYVSDGGKFIDLYPGHLLGLSPVAVDGGVVFETVGCEDGVVGLFLCAVYG